MPGSTAYLVWSQTRNAYNEDGSFDIGDNLNELFTANKPMNVLLLKFSYRFGLR
jgi:hypothetical protein